MRSVMGRRDALRLLAVLSGMALATGCGRGSRPERTVDVAVVGAGLSGLYAAMLLERAGLTVQVFEAADRIGGRLWTLDAIPGAPEGGGNVIGSTYARIVDTARALGVTMERVPALLPEDAGTRLWVNNTLITPDQWSASPLNPFPPAFRSLPPARVLPAMLPPVPLVDQSDWRLPSLAQYDIPITDALTAHRLDADGLELLDVNFGYGNHLSQTSLLHYYHVMANLAAAIAEGGSLMRVVGGNQRLPEAMAAALRDPVLTGTRIQRIARATEGFYRLEVAGGGAYRADRVVLALPTPAFASIDFAPALPIQQRSALAALTYHKVYQAHLVVKRPVWRERGLPATIWSNRSIERVLPHSDSDGNVTNLTLWVNGDGADRFDGADAASAEALVHAELTALYGDAADGLELAALHSWQQQEGYSGAYATWRPGDIQTLTPWLDRPGDGLHFAGEHTARAMRGMEGAMESGERVAIEVLEQLTSALT